MLLTLLRARRRECKRGESGKLAMAVMSLSVKSIASWSCHTDYSSNAELEHGVIRVYLCYA